MTNQSMPIPRIQGKAYELENNKWGWEAVFSFGSTEIHLGVKEDFKGFETKESAIKDLKGFAELTMNEFCKKSGIEHDGFYDLTKNEYVKELK